MLVFLYCYSYEPGYCNCSAQQKSLCQLCFCQDLQPHQGPEFKYVSNQSVQHMRCIEYTLKKVRLWELVCYRASSGRSDARIRA
jgi:hypothetical protein